MYTLREPEATTHQLMVVNYWACNGCEGKFLCPEPFSNVEKLSTAICRDPTMRVLKNKSESHEFGFQTA